MYQIKTFDEKLINKTQTLYALDPFFAKLLVAKGLTQQEIGNIIHLEKALIDPSLLVNALQAASKIADFIKDPLNLFIIFGDYDMDGIASVHICINGLKVVAKCSLDFYIPERKDGYGINMDWCKSLVLHKEAYKNIMVMTVDNGTNKPDEVAYLIKNGIQVIVTDHHEKEQRTADCLIVNPKYHDNDPYDYLAGCGVAFKVIQLVQDLYDINTMEQYMDYLMLGTIGDMMPMTLENISFCYYGLKMLNDHTCHISLRYIADKLNKTNFSYKDVSFDIVPKYNSCGRMGQMDVMRQFILNANEQLADKILKINQMRVKISKVFLKKGAILAQTTSIVWLKECPIGIAGIIASNLSQLYKKDIIVFTDTHSLKGSGRSYNGNILNKLNQIHERFKTLTFGGHAGAIGIKIEKKEFEDFERSYNNLLIEEQEETPAFLIDMELSFEEITPDILNIIRGIPYDKTFFTEPLFLIEADLIHKEPTFKNPDNIWLTLRGKQKQMRVWAKDFTKRANSLTRTKKLKWITTLDEDFMSPGNVTLKIVDVMEE